MIDAVLLEWEGVLTDTALARREALLGAAREEGVDLDPSRYDECCDGLDVSSAASVAVGLAGRDDAVLAELVAMRARRAFAERLGKGLTLHPGACAFVERLSVVTRVALVTSSSRSEAEFLLRLAALEAAVSTIITSNDVLEPSPSPMSYRRAMGQLARVRPVRAEHVVAVVASRRAIGAARAAGIRTVAINVPAHIAVEADGAIGALGSSTHADVARAAGIEMMEPRS